MHNRQERINAEMARAAQNVIAQLKDPRICGIVSVLRAEVTPDLKYAKLFVSVFDSEESRRKTTFDTLVSCRNFIRRSLKGEIDLRVMPEIKFVLDDSLDESDRINEIINRLHREKGE